MNKILIIKVGYSETLDPEIGNVTSYGDVLRTTVLLHLFKDDHVTWLVDETAYPILKGNEYIDRVLIYNLTSVLQLQSEQFDTVINLEKVPGLCALADSVKAWRRFGFRFDERKGQAEAYDGTQYVLSVCRDLEKKKSHASFWQERLYEMVGAQWQGEEFILGYRPTSEEKYDIGFNYQVGNKWPSKMWPRENWAALERLLNGKRTVSWQQGLNNMEQYFEWINSCRLIITNDSFGLHLALALKKKVLALFGPTNYKEHYLHGRGRILIPDPSCCDISPCNSPQCSKSTPCLARVSPEAVLEEIERVLGEEDGYCHVPDNAAQELQLHRCLSYS